MKRKKNSLRQQYKKMCMMELLVHKELIKREIDSQVREYGSI